MTDHPTIQGHYAVIDNRLQLDPQSETPRGNFTEIDMTTPKQRRRDPLAISHAELVRELARMHIPQFNSDPEPDDFEDVADYMLRLSRFVDQHLLAIGIEIKSNAVCVVNLDDFSEVLEKAVEGNATFQADQCAEALRDERAQYADQGDYDRAHRAELDRY